jgi:hypothetical protein
MQNFLLNFRQEIFFPMQNFLLNSRQEIDQWYTVFFYPLSRSSVCHPLHRRSSPDRAPVVRAQTHALLPVAGAAARVHPQPSTPAGRSAGRGELMLCRKLGQAPAKLPSLTLSIFLSSSSPCSVLPARSPGVEPARPVKASRPLIRVLVINDNHYGLTFLFEL